MTHPSIDPQHSPQNTARSCCHQHRTCQRRTQGSHPQSGLQCLWRTSTAPQRSLLCTARWCCRRHRTAQHHTWGMTPSPLQRTGRSSSLHMPSKGRCPCPQCQPHIVCKMPDLQPSTRPHCTQYKQSRDSSPSLQCRPRSQCTIPSPLQRTARWSSSRMPSKGRRLCLQCQPHIVCKMPGLHQNRTIQCMQCSRPQSALRRL